MAWPDLAVLELLVAVAEHGSVSRAATRVGMAQPNATRALTTLERSLGIRLLERGPRGSTLTTHGAVVVDWSRELLRAADRMRVATAALRAERRSQLAVAASMTVAEYLMPAWLTRLRGAHPELELHFDVHNSLDVFELVRSGARDLGFVESPTVPAGLQGATVAHDRLVVVVAQSHPWARRRRPVGVDELAATALVLRERGSGTRDTLIDALGDRAVAPPVLELTSNAAVRIAVASGAGPAVLSELAVADSVNSGELVVVPTSGVRLDRALRAVWRGGGTLQEAASDLILIARAAGAGRPDPLSA